MATPATTGVAPQPELPVTRLREFPNNPRRVWGDMDGLTASVKANGIIEPLVVRPQNGHFEIIAGARRFRAAQAAGLDAVPVTLREASDQVALELAILENLQRHDVHPLDEALGIDRLMKADPAYTVDAVAARLGKSERQIRHTLKLLQLAPEVREAFEQDRITAGHAHAIARLEPGRQKEALKECFFRLFSGGQDAMALRSVRELETWIADHVPLDVAAPETAEMFPDIAPVTSADVGTIHRLSSSWQGFKGKKGEPAILGTSDYRAATKTDPCGATGVIVIGHDRGKVLRVCVDKTCKKHFPPQRSYGAPSSTPQTAAGKKRAAEAHKRQEAAAARIREQRARRELVVARALHVVAGAVKTVSPATLRHLLQRELGDLQPGKGPIRTALTDLFGLTFTEFTFERKSLAKVPEAKLAAALAVVAVANASHDEREFASLVAPFKVDLKKLDAEVKAEQAAAARAAKTAPAKASRGKKR